jgi:hypothetical protein
MFSRKSLQCFKLERRVFKEQSRNRIATIYIPHTCTSWLSNICKVCYILELPTITHKLYRDRCKEGINHLCLHEDLKVSHIWVIWEYYMKEKVSYVLFPKLMQKLQLTWLKEKGNLSQVVPFSNRPKFHGGHIESRSTGMTRSGFMLITCPKVMFAVIQPFLEDE